MSTLDAGSPILPSVSELLAQERFTKLTRACLYHALKILRKTPLFSNMLDRLLEYKDEFLLVIEGILQWLYLHFYSALIGEHFYGLKRTANHRLRSLILSVFLPYVKLKLDSLRKQMHNNDANEHSKSWIIFQLLPKILIFIEGLGWLYRLGYAFGLTKYYSPTLQLAKTTLTYAKDPSPIIVPSPPPSRFFSIISQIISNGLFVIQLIDWWNSSNGSKPPKSTNNFIDSTLPLTTRTLLITRGQRQCLLCRQPCHIPTVILGSGYVYCQKCINDYVQQYHRCPVSNQLVTNENLIRMY